MVRQEIIKFTLREINGCSTKEVAEILTISNELVKWRLHKARTTLRKSLRDNNSYKNMGTVRWGQQGSIKLLVLLEKILYQVPKRG